MRFAKFAVVLAVPALITAGCETMQNDDKARLDKASSMASQADQTSKQALAAANQASARADAAAKAAQDAANQARAAADAANKAAAEARNAGDRADRIFQQSLRK